MKKWLQQTFSLTSKDAGGILKATVLCFIRNLVVMTTGGLFCLALGSWLQHHFETSRLVGVLIAALAIYALLIILEFAIYQATFTRTYDTSREIRLSLAERLRRLPLAFFFGRDLSDFAHAMMRDTANIEQMLSHAVPQLIAALASTTVMVIGFVVFDWRLGLMLLLPLAVSILFHLIANRASLRLGRDFKEATLDASQTLRDTLESIPTLRATNRQDWAYRHYEADQKVYERKEMAANTPPFAAMMAASTIYRLAFPLVAVMALVLLRQGKVELWTVLCLLLFSDMVYQGINAQSVFLYNISVLFSSAERVAELHHTLCLPGTDSFKPKSFDLTFEKVSFNYGDKEVLHDVSFKARQGEVTALVGPSGSGKSTLARLAARFWDPTSGSVSVGGQDLKTVLPESYLKSVSMVFQDVVLLDETVAENIRIGRADATDEEVRAAAHAAQCDDFIAKLPQGLDTRIGENGSHLSGGERQRISIARALLKNAPLVILDEATASLDADNESRLQEAMNLLLKDKTVLVIAHRLRTVMGADHIVVLDDGRVVQEGKPSDLRKTDGLFKRMVELQQRAAEWTL